MASKDQATQQERDYVQDTTRADYGHAPELDESMKAGSEFWGLDGCDEYAQAEVITHGAGHDESGMPRAIVNVKRERPTVTEMIPGKR